MIKFALYILPLLLSHSCGKTPEYIQLVQKITAECSDIIYMEYGLRLIGSGGRLMYDIEEIDSCYQTVNPMSLDEARKIYVGIVQCYLSKTNSDPKLKPFLHTDPFTFENLDIMLSVNASCRQKSNIDSNEKQVVLVYKGRSHQIIYEAYDYSQESYQLIRKESYDEALAIIQESKIPTQTD